MIGIQKVNETTFEVTVQSDQTTAHIVTVDPAYYQKLTAGTVSAEELLKKSFKFLLERESNTSILREFDLPVISRYFPSMKLRLKK